MIDFWKTMFSRIESNVLRGKIGEYIVSWAIGAEETSQDPWQAFDLISPHFKKIEVKTTSFLQDWEHGEKNRNPKFIIKPTRKYTRASGLEKERTYNADIYVLCYYAGCSGADPCPWVSVELGGQEAQDPPSSPMRRPTCGGIGRVSC